MQFIRVQDGKFEVTQEARSLLSNQWSDIPLSIISVVGSYRIGKSSLLNWLTGKIDLFPTSNEVHAQTRGLWMAKDLYENDILYIDSEGLSNIEVSTDYDFKIFALCIAISSKLIVNSGHILKSNELTELKQAGKISQFLSSNAQIKNGMPDLLWLFRNSTLKITDQETKEPISATKYLETSLKKLDPNLSSMLLDLFPNRYAIALPKPSSNDQYIQNQNFRNFDPSFKNAFDLVKTNIITQTSKKHIGSICLTGSLFLTMVDSLCITLSNPQIAMDISTVYSDMCLITKTQSSKTIAMQTKSSIIKTMNKHKSLFIQDDILNLPSFIMKNIHRIMLETPNIQDLATLIQIIINTIKEQEQLNIIHLLKGQLNNENPQDMISMIMNFFFCDNNNSFVNEIENLIKDKLNHNEKIDLLQQELIQSQITIELKQKELHVFAEAMENAEMKNEEKNILIDRLKLELHALTNKILEKENEINQLKLEVNTTNEALEQYMMVIKELKIKWELKNEEKTKLESHIVKNLQLVKEIEDLQQFSRKQAIELESKKQQADEFQEKISSLTKDYNKKMELLHLDILNEKTRNTREEDRCCKRLKVYQDASAQHTIDMNELQSLRQQKISDTNKIADLTTSLLTAKRIQNFHELLKNF